nr:MULTISPECIES: diguanylate cyclase [unclassified Thioalkalivibrio]
MKRPPPLLSTGFEPQGASACQWLGLALLVSLVLWILVPPAALASTSTEQTIEIGELGSMTLREPATFWVTDRAYEPSELPLDQFRPLTSDQINRGITKEAHWVRVRLSNADAEQPQHWVLHHETSYLDEMAVYFSDNGAPLEKVLLSDRQPFAERLLNYRTLAFPHTTPADGYTDLFLRLQYTKPDAMSLNVFLSRADHFHSQSRGEYLIYGGYYGLLAALIIIAGTFSLIMRQGVYLWYAAFLLASILMWALLNGFAFQYLWPNSVFWHNEGFHIVFLAVAITALQFSRLFLQTRYCCPRIDKVILAAQGIMVAGIFLRFAGFYTPVLYLSFASLALLALLPILGTIAYRNGMRYALWYTVAWSLYGLGLLISVFSAGTSLFAWGMAPLAYAQAFSALEAVFLLVALGERLIDWDRDRLQALKIANQDPLTGLGNRRALNAAFDRVKAIPRSSELSVFLIMIDLDNFKAINDHYGHDAGDRILTRLGNLLLQLSRHQDICIRYGGEEFAILLEAPGPEQVRLMAERIRKEFSDTPTDYEGHRIEHTLTAGIGMAPSAGRRFDPDALIRQADAALYQAKNAGRNRVVFQMSEPESPEGQD